MCPESKFSLSILYEDEFLFVLNKPAGLHSVRNPNSSNLSLADLLLERWPQLQSVAEKAGDAGLVNRLDQMTSGIIYGAKSAQAWHSLKQSLHEGEANKSYLVLLQGCFAQGAGEKIEVSNYLGSPNRHARKMKVYQQKPSAKERALQACTSFEVLECNTRLDVSLVRAWAKSARRHQIRAHSSYIGHPLLGDRLYGASRDLKEIFADVANLPDFFLHAQSLSLKHPISGQIISLEAPLPDWFKRWG